MSFLPDRMRPKPVTNAVSRVAQEMATREEDVACCQIRVWAEEQKSIINTESRGRLGRHAMREDMKTWDVGRDLAAGDPVDLEIALGYLEDQHIDNRKEVRRP